MRVPFLTVHCCVLIRLRHMRKTVERKLHRFRMLAAHRLKWTGLGRSRVNGSSNALASLGVSDN